MSAAPAASQRWADAWPDLAAFALGLAAAWWLAWDTTDLVWSLWLSSLVVGYALIVKLQTEPLREVLRGVRADRSGIAGAGAKTAAVAITGVATLFGLVFFTVHFGGFHLGHSAFLNFLFPIHGRPTHGLIDWSVYPEVVARYWWFLPMAFIAERDAFRRATRDPDTRVTPDAIAARKARGDAMMLPYKNVVRMHLLIFFFMAAHFARLENFVVYAVVYAVYFFPWRLLKRGESATAKASVLGNARN